LLAGWEDSFTGTHACAWLVGYFYYVSVSFYGAVAGFKKSIKFVEIPQVWWWPIFKKSALIKIGTVYLKFD
jgi:hypothetical protein